MCCVANTTKTAWPGWIRLGYKCPGYGGFIFVIWPQGWQAPATGTFGGGDGILPKEVFGGKGGIGPPPKNPPPRNGSYDHDGHDYPYDDYAEAAPCKQSDEAKQDIR